MSISMRGGVDRAQCPICDSGSELLFTKFDCQYYRCICGFVFIWPRPSTGALEDLYRRHGDDYWTTERMVNFAFAPTKSSREIAFVKQHASFGRLLDVGCSTGSFVKSALSSGFEAKGCDISEPSVLLGQKMGLPLVVADILNENLREEYDLVTMWATLEHLPEPRQHLERARALLRSGGLLFVSVPNYSSFTQATLGKWDRYVGDQHLNYFTPEVLRTAIESCGLSVLGQTTFGFNPLIFVKDLRNHGRRRGECEQLLVDSVSTLKLKQSRLLLYLQRATDKVLNMLRWGDVVAIAAAKS